MHLTTIKLVPVIVLEGGPGVEGWGGLRDWEGGFVAVVEDFDQDLWGAVAAVED